MKADIYWSVDHQACFASRGLALAFIALTLIAGLWPIQSYAERLIPFQARLTDASGQPVDDGVYTITFSIYDAPLGGTAIIQETHDTVSVIGGYVNVLLGAIESLEDKKDSPEFSFVEAKYLGITVGAGQEMVPRHQLVPSFHARTAENAYRAEMADLAEEARRAYAVVDGGVTRAALNPDLQGVLVPSGTVIFFDGNCPAGWSEFSEARGRLIVGLPSGGTMRGVQGAALGDRENRTHTHALTSDTLTGSLSSYTHGHRWSRWAAGANDWFSFSSAGGEVRIISWGNGLDEDGDGISPLARNNGHGSYTFYTDKDTHSHDAGTLRVADRSMTNVSSGMPTIQLRVCRKD